MQLGTGTHISQPVYIDGLQPWLITIDDYVTLAPYVAILTHDASLAHHTGHTRIGRVVIGKRVNVGVGAVLLPGTSVGDDSVIGAGAVVHGEIPPGSLVVGNPPKVSPIKAVAAWHRASARRGHSWPIEGWTIFSGITDERKRAQRQLLSDGSSGYLPAFAAPGGPYTRANGRRAPSPDASEAPQTN
jgi:acetyltransferase-like isoleucine patch superfamily enzyme